jgi:hypothetical protein
MEFPWQTARHLISALTDSRSRTLALISDLIAEQLSVPLLPIIKPIARPTLWNAGNIVQASEPGSPTRVMQRSCGSRLAGRRRENSIFRRHELQDGRHLGICCQAGSRLPAAGLRTHKQERS